MNVPIDLAFNCLGNDPLAADHAYALYGAVSRVLPQVHGENGYALHPIRGRQVGGRRMILTPASRLTLRLPADRIGEALPLAGKSLRIGDATVQIGVPEVRPLIPAPALRSRLVTIKGFFEPESFEQAARRQLNHESLAISETATITVVKKRTLRIKDREIVGFETLLEGLTAEESLRLQEVGIGGRRHLGCGVFVEKKTAGDRE